MLSNFIQHYSRENLMTRLFLSLYVGLLLTAYGFIYLSHIISTYLIIDIENITAAEKLSAEVTLLEKLSEHTSEDEYQSLMNMIAEKNQLVIELIKKNDVPPNIRTALENNSVWFDDEEFDYFTTFSGNQYYRIKEDEKHTLVKIADTVDSYIIAGLIFCVTLCCLIWFFGFHYKLALIEKTLIKISDGDLKSRAPKSQFLQVGRLNRSVNMMAEKITHLLSSHKRLTYIIAHELRTPLFRMQLNLELLDIKSLSNVEHINGLEEDIYHLEDMVDELLNYAKMERAELQPTFIKIELNSFIKSLCEKLSKDDGNHIFYEDALAYHTHIDPSLIARAITNLVVNAKKYGKGKVFVSLMLQERNIVISVADNGEGIKDDQKSKVFEPYYRLDNTGKKIGFGLGLAIVKEITLLHSGTISVTDSEHSGAEFCLILPR